jgi:hypothetical protein
MKDLFPILNSTYSHIFYLANKLYVKEEFTIHEEFKQTVKSVFSEAISTLMKSLNGVS